MKFVCSKCNLEKEQNAINYFNFEPICEDCYYFEGNEQKTLRDEIAIEAMKIIMKCARKELTDEDLVKWSFKMADEFMKQRNE